MRLQFGLLWIEDNYSEAEEASLRRAAEIAGFEIEITSSIDGADLEKHALDQQKYHLFDLVLLDLKLAQGVMGDDLAGRVRSLFRSTPILFYSGSEDAAALRRRMADRRIEGIFCAHRDEFTTRAGELISDLAMSLNRLSGMRGLSMEVVAQADLLCREVVLELAKAEHNQFAIDHLNEAVKSLSAKTLEEFPALEGLDARLASRSVDSMKLFNLFRELVKKSIKASPAGIAKDELAALSGASRNFRAEVIEIRNILGHALECRSDEGWQILDKNGDVLMTVNDFTTHRANFLANLRAIRELHRLLIPQ